MFRLFAFSLLLTCAAGATIAQPVSAAASADSAAAPKPGTRVTNFSGGVVDQNVTLNWETVNEANIQEFVVEHAPANGAFEAVGKLPAKGSGKYAFRYKAVPGAAQARLRILKTSGETKFTEPLGLVPAAAGTTLEASPNPASSHVQINGLGYGDQASLLGANGQTVRNFTAARSSEVLNLEGLPAGVYLLQVRSAEGEQRPGLRIVKR